MVRLRVLYWTQNCQEGDFKQPIPEKLTFLQRSQKHGTYIQSFSIHPHSTFEARAQPPTSFRLRDLPPWVPKMLSPRSLGGCYFLFQEMFDWQSKQPNHFQGRSSSPFDPWHQSCNQKKARSYVRRLNEAIRSIQSAPGLLAIPVQRANQSTSEDVFALAGSGLAGFG